MLSKEILKYQNLSKTWYSDIITLISVNKTDKGTYKYQFKASLNVPSTFYLERLLGAKLINSLVLHKPANMDFNMIIMADIGQHY